ncbi:MAG: hypothetical protein ACU0FT_12790, partial [Paracoccus sp. (in: a-proteobacteria)]
QSDLWRGFQLSSFIVTLPEKLSRSGERTTIYGTNMLIDDSGISGVFGATNLFSVGDGGDMNGWGFSLDDIHAELTSNQLTGGGLSGKIIVPPLDDNQLNYTATITASQQGGLDYQFLVSPASNITMDVFKSDLEIYSSSTITVSIKNGKFDPKMTLNGKLDLTESSVKLKAVTFQALTFETSFPYITNGTFSLVSSPSNPQNDLGKFPISVTNITLGLNNNKVTLGADVAFNITESGGNAFSVATGIKVISNITDNGGSPSFTFDRVKGDGPGADAPLAGSLDALGYPPAEPETRLAAFRLRFRPWAKGPESAEDRMIAAALTTARPGVG